MKWFKHFSMAKYDTKIMRLIRAHKAEGYGIYFACLEYIASKLDPSHPYPDMEETDKDIAEFFDMDSDKVRDVIQFCLKEGLFQKDEKTGRLVCLKMLAHLDNTLSNSPQIKGILQGFDELKVNLSEFKRVEETCSRLDTDKIKIKKEKKKKETKELALATQPPDVDELFDMFYQNLLTKKLLPIDARGKVMFFKNGKKHCAEILKQNSLDDCRQVLAWAFQDTTSFRAWASHAIFPSDWTALKSGYAQEYVKGSGKVSQKDIDEMERYMEERNGRK